MRRIIPATTSLLSLVVLVCAMLTPLTPRARTQEIVGGAPAPAIPVGGFQTTASNLIIPQARAYALRPQAQQIQISEVAADIRIVHQVATTSAEDKDKIALFCDVEPKAVIPLPTMPNIYHVPLWLEERGLGDYIVEKLNLGGHAPDLASWKATVARMD